MGFLQQVKFNYYQNQIKDLISLNNYSEIKQILIRVSQKDEVLFKELLNKFLDNFIGHKELEDLFKKNIFWLNVFDDEELKIITDFLNYYLEKVSPHTVTVLNYSEIFLSKMKKDTNFEEFLNQNYAIQLDINFSFEFPVVINNSSFFVSENKKNIFTHEFFTDSYIYIVKNPYDIYKKNKSTHRNKFDSLNYLLNSDHHFYTYLSQDGLKLDLPREGWHTNLSSWADQEVIDRFNGIFFQFEEIKLSPLDFFSSILLRMKDRGLPIDINYNVINSFISEKLILPVDVSKIDISNQELKQINNTIKKTIDDLQLDY